MSFPAKRELLIQLVPRYAEAIPVQKGIILGEFIQVTGYSRKYAIRIVSQSKKQPSPLRLLSNGSGPENMARLCKKL